MKGRRRVLSVPAAADKKGVGKARRDEGAPSGGERT